MEVSHEKLKTRDRKKPAHMYVCFKIFSENYLKYRKGSRENEAIRLSRSISEEQKGKIIELKIIMTSHYQMK